MSKKNTKVKENIIEEVELNTDSKVQEQETQEVQLKLKGQPIIGKVEEQENQGEYDATSISSNDNPNPIVIEQVEEKVVNVKSYKGIVINTSKLNVRKLPSLESDIIDVIKNKDTLMINPSKSTATFYHVTLDNGLEGYCVRDYIVG